MMLWSQDGLRTQRKVAEQDKSVGFQDESVHTTILHTVDKFY